MLLKVPDIENLLVDRANNKVTRPSSGCEKDWGACFAYDPHDRRNYHHHPKISLDDCDDPDNPWFTHDRSDRRSFYGWIHQKQMIDMFSLLLFTNNICPISESIRLLFKIACLSFSALWKLKATQICEFSLSRDYIKEQIFPCWGIVHSVARYNILVLWFGFLWKHCEYLA